MKGKFLHLSSTFNLNNINDDMSLTIPNYVHISNEQGTSLAVNLTKDENLIEGELQVESDEVDDPSELIGEYTGSFTVRAIYQF